MRHAAKVDWWVVFVALAGILAPLSTHAYWASGLVVGVLLAGAFPQSYKTTPRGLLVRSGLTRRLIPYECITFIGPAPAAAGRAAFSRGGMKVEWGLSSKLLVAPADPRAFFLDLAARAPHLSRRGQELAASCL